MKIDILKLDTMDLYFEYFVSQKRVRVGKQKKIIFPSKITIGGFGVILKDSINEVAFKIMGEESQ